MRIKISRKKLITMSKFNLIMAGLMVGGACTVGLLTGQPANAQATFGNSGDARDPLSRASTGDTSGLLQLMQNLQNGRQRDPNEVAREQSQQIDGAASNFRAEQLRRIRAQQASKK
jgi:hypothetical protein